MKNLFKNLMLVAVAAMAFTACTESNNEVNAVTKKVVLEFVADLADDDTRVAFGEKDGNKYPVVWEAYDNVSVKVGENQAWYTLTEEDVLESGKKAIIRPEFELLEDETLSGNIVATVNGYPYLAEQDGNKPTISLKAEAEYPATNLVFEHQYAYGKMELVGLPAEFNVTEVKLNLVGGGKELNHTISGNSVEDNIFWFTTEAMEAVESFAVYASNGAVTYYREVTVEKNFAFEVGKVSAFRVKELVVKPADFNVQLTKITSMSNNVIRFEGDNAEDNITITFNPGLETIVAGHYDAVGQDWFNGGVWAWSSDSALEVKDEFEGSSVDVNAAGGISWYYSQNGVDVSVDGDVYTIVAHLKNYCNPDGNKTVDFTYVGKLETLEPEALVFTSARWVNASLSDKLVQFYTEDGATLQLNWYECGSDNWIVPNTYGFASYGAIFWGGEYSWYENAAAGIDTEIVDGTVTVSIVDRKYYIEFKNLADNDKVQIESATFTGEIAGLIIPDMREKLAKPTNVQVSVSGKTITTTWEAVEGAEGYLFELYNPVEEAFTQIVEEGTSFSFTGLNSNWNYYFKLTAYASDENSKYRNSDEIYLEARTEDTDPKMEISESALSFTADGGEKTFTVTLKNTNAAIVYTQVGDWFTVAFSGDTFTVNATANESETDAREGSITVTAGELSQTIDVTQSKKGGEDPNALKIWKINVGYDEPGEKEIQFYFNPDSPASCHVIDFKGFDNVQRGQPLAAGYYSTTDYSIDGGYSIYDYGTTNGTPSFVDCTVTDNADGTQTYEARMVYNSVTYSWTYTGKAYSE